MSDITSVTEALRSEFSTEIVFQEAPPSTFSAPSIVVTPGEPFITPDSHGVVEENWDVFVVVGMKDKASGFAQLRKLSLRVFAAVRSVGGYWREAGGPLVFQADAKTLIISTNRVSVKYDPSDYLEE